MKLFNREKSAKDFYKKYKADTNLIEINRKECDIILSYNPISVLEFGCGTGKNLFFLKDHIQKVSGIDISKSNIEFCKNGFGLDSCKVGDEANLLTIPDNKYDIVFTCSVLDHIETIEKIISEFKRIAAIGIVLAETNNKPTHANYYYPHDYESFGFNKIDYEYKSIGKHSDGATYYIWKFEKK